MQDDQCDLLCLTLPRAQALRQRRVGIAQARVAARAAQALSDPTRLTIAALLHAGDELCVCDLAWLTGRETNVVSHHLQALRRSGLATSRRNGKLVLYSLTAAGRPLLQAVLAFTPLEAVATRPGEEVEHAPEGVAT
jgi:DNA-binding transcriptional ArsR family regulator